MYKKTFTNYHNDLDKSFVPEVINTDTPENSFTEEKSFTIQKLEKSVKNQLVEVR